MGKRSEKLYMRASEHAELGGAAAASRYITGRSSQGGGKPLPFGCCSLTLNRFEEAVASPSGVMFSAKDIVPHLMRHPFCPVLGTPLKSRDLIKLKMVKDENGDWTCPVIAKRFTDHTKVVMIVKNKEANVFSFEAVQELNYKAKNWYELIDGFKFSKKDVVALQDPDDQAVCARRNVSAFKGAAKDVKAATVHQVGEVWIGQ